MVSSMKASSSALGIFKNYSFSEESWNLLLFLFAFMSLPIFTWINCLPLFTPSKRPLSFRKHWGSSSPWLIFLCRTCHSNELHICEWLYFYCLPSGTRSPWRHTFWHFCLLQHPTSIFVFDMYICWLKWLNEWTKEPIKECPTPFVSSFRNKLFIVYVCMVSVCRGAPVPEQENKFASFSVSFTLTWIAETELRLLGLYAKYLSSISYLSGCQLFVTLKLLEWFNLKCKIL